MQLRANREGHGEERYGVSWDGRKDVLDRSRGCDEGIRPVHRTVFQCVQKFVKHSNST